MTGPEGNSLFCFPRRSRIRIIVSFRSYALVYRGLRPRARRLRTWFTRGVCYALQRKMRDCLQHTA